MGQFFSFGKKELPRDTVADSTAAAAPLGVESSGHPILTQARESARASLESSPRRRGRPSKTEETLRTGSPALPAELQQEIQKQLEGALEQAPWAALLALPADTALAITGREHWKVSPEERKTLGATGSAFARTMMISNPRTLCALMLASALFSVYIPRASEEMKFQQAKRAAAKGKPPEEKKP